MSLEPTLEYARICKIFSRFGQASVSIHSSVMGLGRCQQVEEDGDTITPPKPPIHSDGFLFRELPRLLEKLRNS